VIIGQTRRAFDLERIAPRVVDIVTNARRSAAAANAADLSVDVNIFLIESLRRQGRGNIDNARLAVTDRRRPGPGRGFSCGQSWHCDRH
jgi:hypothetical protein